ncbi:ankyrin repeat-containing domain protein [Lasiosphaeris hirsuta]|uniref:Ankyrin repeat-containing domain protein n=1 Tax=Lasiosphaeris hirsuta TaxID=260670 RepID=A0AA40A1E9_9PEZI|nr:ankyrin repeat-containing domain protein [Lasiosphaeris hirsuta]
MTESASTSTLGVEQQTWCASDGAVPSVDPTTVFSRSASEEALARMGWKSAPGRPKPIECRELVPPNRSLATATPSVWMHSNKCSCGPRPAPSPADGALAAQILATSEVYRSRSKSSSGISISLFRKTPKNPSDKKSKPRRRSSGLFSLFASSTPAPPSPSKMATLCLACSALDAPTAARYLFDEGLPVNTHSAAGITPLIAAVRALDAASKPQAHLAFLTFLLDCGADPNATTLPRPGTQVTSVLGAAAALGLVGAVRLLLARGAAVDAPLGKKGMTALHAAVLADRPDAVACLLADGGANVAAACEVASAGPEWKRDSLLVGGPPGTSHSTLSVANLSTLSLSTYSARGLSLKQLRPKTAETREGGGKGVVTKAVTALHLACGSYACAGVLVRHGADAAARDGHGRTPVHWAVDGGSADVVALLTAPGPAAGRDARRSSDVGDDEGATPLAMVVARVEAGAPKPADPEIVRLLLEDGANADLMFPRRTSLRRRLLKAERWRKVYEPLLDEFGFGSGGSLSPDTMSERGSERSSLSRRSVRMSTY